MRAIVLADAHAQPWLIENALEHSHYDKSKDKLIFAGDWLDIGPEPKECLLLLEEMGAEMLIGNHELAIATRTLICPQDFRSWSFEDFITDKIINRQWGVVTLWDRVVISHAGFSMEYESELSRKTAPEFVDSVNRRFFDRFLTSDLEFTGMQGPLWWRPDAYRSPAQSIKQIVGHTPPELLKSYRNFHVIDPYNSTKFEKDRFRYAIIQDGEVTVVDSNEI